MTPTELFTVTISDVIARNPAAARVLVQRGMSCVEREHDRAGELLAELRSITGGYVAPDWACGTFRSLYRGLEEVERDMHVGCAR